MALARLVSLEASVDETSDLVRRLQSPDAADERIALSAQIHQALRDVEDEMELLRVETHALDRRRPHARRDSAPVDTKAVVLLAKLEEDLITTRSKFRRAQIEAKRSSEAARNRQRELLFQSDQRDGRGEGQRRTARFTHGDLVANSSKDVTAALRQTHHLMQAELSRSQFAQEALEQSNRALGSLSESYSNLDTLLASSRSLVGSLLRSQKSDTWYLETAFYILIGTISWLIFRRIFYGPLWWLVWLPLKLLGRFSFAVLGVSGGARSVAVSSSRSIPTAVNVGPTVTHSLWNPEDTPVVRVPGDAGEGGAADVVEELNRWMEAGSESGTLIPDGENGPTTLVPRDLDVPPNPKKRMWEEPAEREL